MKTRCQAQLRDLTDELNRFGGRPASGFARRVARETAVRRRRSVRAGHDAPVCALTVPALARTQPRPHFALSALLRRSQRPQLQHRSPPPSLPATGLSGHSSITEIPPPSPQHHIASPSGRCLSSVSPSAVQRLAGAPPPPSVAVARPNPTTAGHDSASNSFLVVH